MPELPIVDAHHHLWVRPHERYLLEEFQRDLAEGHRIVATVHVQCGSHYRREAAAHMAPVGETEFASETARRALQHGGATQVCAGIVGYADLRDEAVEEVLLAHLAADPLRFKGIRQATAWDDDARLVNPLMKTAKGLYLDADFRRGFARLAGLGLSFDAWALHPQLPEVVALARAFPVTVIVVDHIGAPVGEGRYAGRRAEVRESWMQGIRALADCPNVVMKLGGLGLPILGFGLARGAMPLDSEALARVMRPWIEPCVEHFGAERCMFESNFPVDRHAYRYKVGWNAFKRIAEGWSPAEQALLFHDTAARVYRLGRVAA
ncbi:MAG: amidohydrolase family protein [Gammaproteobacteria bacterium]|nr:amidohydrolase family protein [Gammaproteobacteria bacterium]MBU2408647.1 amidohydrolase family protein [Gammaproteobacteria bacterium]